MFEERNEIFSNLYDEFCQSVPKLTQSISSISYQQRKFQIVSMYNETKKNFLIFSAKENCFSVLKELLDYGFDIDHQDADGFNAIDYAWMNFIDDKKDQEFKANSEKVIISLLNANSKLSSKRIGFSYDKAPNSIKEFIDKSEALHRIVESSNIEELRESFDCHQHLRFFYDRNNQSLMLYALKRKKYDCLKEISDRLSIGKHESLNEVYFTYSNISTKEYVHKNQKLPKPHILLLKSKSQICGETHQNHQNWKCIVEAYQILDEVKICSKILNILALSSKLQILFDFDAESNEQTGLNKKLIYIPAAQNLLDEKEKTEFIKRLIYKFSFVVLSMLHLQFCDHQTKDENEGTYLQKNELEEVVKIVFNQNNKSSFDYFASLNYSELIYCLKVLCSNNQTIKYENLIESMKAKVTCSKISFQGVETTLRDIVSECTEILNFISSDQIKNIILKDKTIHIGKIGNEELAKYFIDRKFIENGNIKSVDELIIDSHECKVLILADNIGTGKTTAFKVIATKLKEYLKASWINYINFNEKADMVDQIIEEGAAITKDNVADTILRIIGTESKLEIEIFKKLFCRSRVVLLLDEIDKLNTIVADFIIAIVEVIHQNWQNQIWISTSPEFLEKLRMKINLDKVYKLGPLETTEQLNLACELFTESNHCLIDFILPVELLSFLKALENRGDNCKLLLNPLLIEKIVKQFFENKNDFAESSLNFYGVFERIYKNHFYIEDLQNETNPIGLFTLTKYHQVHALEVLFENDNPESDLNLKNLAIIKNWKREKQYWTLERSQKTNFLFNMIISNQTNGNLINFIHISFAEYFVAQFISSFMFSNDHYIRNEEFENIFKLLEAVAKPSNNYEVVVKFLQSLVRNNNQIKVHIKMKEVISKNTTTIAEKIENSDFSYILFWLGILQNENDIVKDIVSQVQDKNLSDIFKSEFALDFNVNSIQLMIANIKQSNKKDLNQDIENNLYSIKSDLTPKRNNNLNSSVHNSQLFGSPEVVITFSNETIEFNTEALSKMLLHEEVKNRKIVVLSIAGAFKSGKSLFLNYCLRFLYANYRSINYPQCSIVNNTNWMGDEHEPLLGFSSNLSTKPCTIGIVFWNDVFLFNNEKSGEELAIILMDTQSLFCNETSEQEALQILNLSILMSSIQVFNLRNIMQQYELLNLKFAIEFAELSAMNLNSDKPFQIFMFLIRDWMYCDEYDFGFEGGIQYLNSVLDKTQNQTEEFKSVSKFIKGTFDTLECFLLGHPGHIVSCGRSEIGKFNGNWSDMNLDFAEQLFKLIENLLLPKNLAVKKIAGIEVKGKEFFSHIENYLKLFKDNKIPTTKTIYQSSIEVDKKIENLSVDVVQQLSEIDDVCVYRTKTIILDEMIDDDDQITEKDNRKFCENDFNKLKSILNCRRNMKIDEQHVLKITKNAKSNSNENKLRAKVIHLTSEWEFEEILSIIDGLNFQQYENLLFLIIEDTNFGFLDENLEKSEEIQKNLCKFGSGRPLVLQMISNEEKVSKIYIKETESKSFLNIDQRKQNHVTIQDFASFLWSLLDTDNTSIYKLTAGWQQIIKSPLTIKFLKLFELIYKKVILEVVKSGTVADLLTVLEAPIEHEGRILSIEVQNILSESIPDSLPDKKSSNQANNEKMSSKDVSSNESINNQVIVDESASSVLLTAVEHKNIEVINYLVTYWPHLLQELPAIHQMKISTAAFKTNQLDVLCDLLDIVDFPFPEDYEFDDEQEHKRLRKITLDRVAFTSAIKKENFKKIDEFMDCHMNLKCVYSIDNETALTQSIACKKFGVFYYLKSLGFQGEDCEDILDELDEEDRKKATKQAVKQRKSNVKATLVNVHKSVLLLATSSLIHNKKISVEQEDEYRQKIKNWFQDIYVVAPEMLDVAASCEYLKIIFDFESITVENASLVGPNSLGSTYPISKWIFIGAQLSDKKREQHIKGVLANELCHYVMRLVYENKGNPYYDDRVDVKEQFIKIVKAIDKWSAADAEYQNDECSQIISSVFTLFIFEDHHSELIVRVVQMLTEFDDDEEKTRHLQEKYQDLFSFWYNQVVPELERYFYKKDLKKLNEFVGLLPKILKHKMEVKSSKIYEEVITTKIAMIITNTPMLLFVDICNFLQKKEGTLMDSKNLFIDIEKLNNLEIWKTFVQILSYTTQLNIFVDCTREIPASLPNIFVKKDLDFIFVWSNESQCIEFIRKLDQNEMKNITKRNINYNWSDLTEDTQKLLLETKINFQNNSEISLNDLFKGKVDLESEIFDLRFEIMPDWSEVIDDKIFNLIIDEKKLTINSSSELNQNERYFERKFLRNPKNSSNAHVNVVKTYDSGYSDDESNSDEKFQNLSEKELLFEIKNQKYILISDKAGNGKSWAMKNFTRILRTENPTSWVTYVDLKQLIKEFKAQIALKTMPEFSSFMAEKILKTEHKFESKVFQKLYKDGKVFILFDGFDEIAPNCAEFVSNLAQSFQSNGGNQLWIATRDYFDVDFMEKLRIDVAYGLGNMSNDDGENFIASSWIMMDSVHKKRIGPVSQPVETFPNFEEYKTKAKQIIKKVKNCSKNSIGMVQMFKMIADAYKDEQDIEKLKESKIFENLIISLYRRSSSEKSLIREESNIENLKLNFWEFHQYHAVASLFPELAKILFADYDGKIWTVNEAITCGILSINRDGKIYFLIETYQKYFAADVLAKLFKNDKVDEKILEVLADVLTLSQHKVIRMFMNDFIDFKISFKVQAKIKKYKAKFHKIECFFEFFTENLENLVDFVLSILKDGDYKKIKKVLKRNFEQIGNNIKNSKMLFKFHVFMCQFLSANDLKEMIKSEEIFKTIINGEGGAETFANFIQQIEKKLKHDFIKKHLKKAVSRGWMQEHNFNFFFKVTDLKVPEYQKFLKTMQKFLSSTEMLEFLKKKNDWRDENILSACVKKGNNEMLRILWREMENYFASQNMSQDFKEFVMQHDKYKQNLFHEIAQSDNLKFHKTFWELSLNTIKDREELKDFVLQKDYEGNNFVHELVRSNNNPEIIEWTFKLLKENFNDFQLHKIIQSKGSFNRNLIHSTLFGGHNIETFEFLWKHFLSSFKSNQEFWKVLKEVDDDGKNVLNYAAWKSSVGVFNFLIDEFEKNISCNEIQKMLSDSDKWNQSFLHHAVLNKSTDTFKAVWRNFKKYLKSEEILKITKQVGSENFSNFLFCIESSETFVFVIEELEKFLSHDEIRSLLGCTNERNKNILQYAACSGKSKNLHETLKKVLRKYFEQSEIKNIIQIIDED